MLRCCRPRGGLRRRTQGSPLHVVTSAQRARLVVAMGLLNLILATVALTAGVVVPTPDRGIAVSSPVPSTPAAAASAEPGVPTPGQGSEGPSASTSPPV